MPLARVLITSSTLMVRKYVLKMMEPFIGSDHLIHLYCMVLGVLDNIIDKDGRTHAYRNLAALGSDPRNAKRPSLRIIPPLFVSKDQLWPHVFAPGGADGWGF